MRKFQVVCDAKRTSTGDIRLPERSSKFSAGYDFFSPVNVTINPGESKLIFTDVKALFHNDEVLMLYVRSSMGKYPVVLANGTGIIDFDYADGESDGNIGFRLMNLGDKPYVINKGDRIGQGVLLKYLTFENGNTDAKRIDGFGSSGR